MFEGDMIDQYHRLELAAIFNTMRILKRHNQGDLYYEAYKGHLERSGEEFWDIYMLMWQIGSSKNPPKKILEIGTRTGISLCQLLSAYLDTSKIEEINCIDPFADGFLSPHLVQANLKALNLPWDKVNFMIGKSDDMLPALILEGKKYDYILVDGDHSKDSAKRDLNHAHQLIEPKGVILFDDISTDPGECGLIDVWESWKSEYRDQYDFEEVMVGKGVAWAIRK